MPRQFARCEHGGCTDTVDCVVHIKATGKNNTPHVTSRAQSYCAEHGEQMYHALLVLMQAGVPDETEPADGLNSERAHRMPPGANRAPRDPDYA